VRCLLSVLALTLSAGCAGIVPEASGIPFNLDGPQPPAIRANAQEIRVAGTLFRRLTGAELRRAVVGNMIFLDPSVVFDSGTSHADGAWFAADGRTYYWSRFRLGHGRGAYVVHRERVCMSANREGCFTLFRSADGRFLRHMPPWQAPALITVRPIPADWSPRLEQARPAP